MAKKKQEPLYDKSVREFQSHITRELGRAVEALYNLRIDLNNSYFGVPDSRNDRAIRAMVEQVSEILELTSSTNFFKYYDDIGKS